MRWKTVLYVVPLLGAPLWAAEASAPPAAPQTRMVYADRVAQADMVRAATAGAVDALYREIADQPLSRTLSVGQFIQITEQREEFFQTLHRADQIGAPRWIDSRTVQVQLQISTEQIKRDLLRIVGAAPKATSLTSGEIQRVVDRWPRRFFTATGTSTAARDITDVRPRSTYANPRWAAVTAEARRQAIRAASADATSRAMSCVSPVLLSDRRTLGETFAVPEVGQAVRNWLADRPVTQVDFRDNLQVEIVLGINEHDYFSVVENALKRQQAVAVPRTPEDWRRIERDFTTRFTAPVGRASVAEAHPQAIKESLRLPAEPPEWIDRQIQVTGEAKGRGPELKTSLAAEGNAKSALATRLDALRWDRNLTLGEAAKQDGRVADALARAVKYARISKIEYRPDGQVVVHMYCDLRYVWGDILQTFPR